MFLYITLGVLTYFFGFLLAYSSLKGITLSIYPIWSWCDEVICYFAGLFSWFGFFCIIIAYIINIPIIDKPYRFQFLFRCQRRA